MYPTPLTETELRKVERQIVITKPNYAEIKWEEINFIDINPRDTIRLTDPDGTRVTHEDGRDTFVAKSKPRINDLGVLEIEI